MMRDYWVTYANTDYDAKRLGVQRLEYPLSMHIPADAVTFENTLFVSTKTKVFDLGVGIAMKLSGDIYQQALSGADATIESYSLMVSTTNSYHIDGIKSRVVVPSDQDEADSEYCTRWWEKSNFISGELTKDLNELSGKTVEVGGPGFKNKGSVDYFHSGVDIVGFLSGFTPLYKGSYIGLGHIMRERLHVDEAEGMIIKVSLDSFAEVEVKLCLTP